MLTSFRSGLSVLSLVCLSAIAPALFAPRVDAQDPPAETFQPGPWQPEAIRFNPQKPVQLTILNKTGSPLRYERSGDLTEPRQLAAGGTGGLSEVDGPTYVFIYPESGNLALDFAIGGTDLDNKITVTVTPAKDSSDGQNTVNLHQTGAVYIY
ncbi:MAG: hypothetical protein AAGG02_09860 [Cyanobacteria bacterium P01_H01_bin.15]